MIIIEGMDNSGKTTLCKSLSKTYGLPLDTSGRLKTLSECVQFQIHCMVSSELIIYDRMRIISEGVYGPLIRNRNVFGDKWGSYLEVFMRTNPLVIYCRPPNEKILEFGEREQMDGVIDHSRQLLSRYDAVMNEIKNFTTNYVVYNYVDPRQKMKNRITQYITQHKHRIQLSRKLSWKS